MSDEGERRERYALELYRTLGVSAERHPWTGLSPVRREVWYNRADAVMALADEEIREALRAERARPHTEPSPGQD